MGQLTMSVKERRRVEVLSRVRDGQVSVSVAAGLLGGSERQAWRVKRGSAAGGDGGVAQEWRGQWCWRMGIMEYATGRGRARFYEKARRNASFDGFGRYVKARGLPRALYVGKAGIYRPEEACPPT